MKKMIRNTIAGLIVVALQSCGAVVVEETKNEQTNQNETGPFLDMGFYNQAYPQLEPISASQITEAINSVTLFYLNAPNDGPEEDAPSSAQESGTNCAIITDEITSNGENSIELNFFADTNRCDQVKTGGDHMAERVRVYASWTCSNERIDTFAGSRASNKFGLDFCPNDAKKETKLHAERILTASNGSKTIIKRTTNASMASDGSSCVQTMIGDSIHIVDCGSYQSQSIGTPQQTQMQALLKFEGKNLKGTVGGTFYESGLFDVAINQWKGQVQFGAFGVVSSDQPPQYRLTRGTTAVEGTFQFRPPQQEEQVPEIEQPAPEEEEETPQPEEEQPAPEEEEETEEIPSIIN